MIYAKDQLFDMPVSKLVDIILNMQAENEQVSIYKRRLDRINKIVNEPILLLNANELRMTNINPDKETISRRGRPRLSDEERAQRIEERRQIRLKAYALAKELKNEEELPMSE